MENGRRRSGWRPLGPIIAAPVSLVIVAVACALFFGPQLYSLEATGALIGPTLPQSPLTGVYARARVDRVHVTRTSDETDPLPLFDKTVTSAATAQALYNAAFALPAYPSGTINCPLGSDITYHLAFTYHDAPILTVNANGCERVSLGGLGDRLANGEFWRALTDALDIPEQVIWSSGA